MRAVSNGMAFFDRTKEVGGGCSVCSRFRGAWGRLTLVPLRCPCRHASLETRRFVLNGRYGRRFARLVDGADSAAQRRLPVPCERREREGIAGVIVGIVARGCRQGRALRSGLAHAERGLGADG